MAHVQNSLKFNTNHRGMLQKENLYCMVRSEIIQVILWIMEIISHYPSIVFDLFLSHRCLSAWVCVKQRYRPVRGASQWGSRTCCDLFFSIKACSSRECLLIPIRVGYYHEPQPKKKKKPGELLLLNSQWSVWRVPQGQITMKVTFCSRNL